MSSMADAQANAGMAELYPILRGSALAPGGADEVGNKGRNLMRMARAGLAVPPASVLPTAWCGRTDAVAKLPEALARGVRVLEDATRHAFGGARRPLLVSVRSGAAVSMPGMMETVLDVGLNAQTVEALIRETGNPRLAWDSYRRLVQGYAEVVAGFPTAPFDALVAAAVVAAQVETNWTIAICAHSPVRCWQATVTWRGKPFRPTLACSFSPRPRPYCGPGTRRRRSVIAT
jgi:pyruvate, orthophosphate dikinase